MMPLTLLNKYILRLGAIALLSTFTLTGCPKEEIKTPDITQKNQEKYHIYIIFTPVTKEQAGTAFELLKKAKNNGGNTGIFIEGNTYTIVMLCQENGTPDFPTSGKLFDTNTNIQSLTHGVQTNIKNIYHKKEPCKSKSNSLVKMATHLQNAAQNTTDKLIVFWQVPWSKDELDKSKKDLVNLKPTIDNLGKTNKVEQVILFGVNTSAPASLATYFQALDGKTDKNTDMSQDEDSLKKIHQKLVN